MNAAENVVKMPDLLERLAERAIRAARAYEVGISKHSGTRADVINAVIDYGKALLEGRVENASNSKFHAWVKDSGIDQIKPFDLRQERTAAMQIAEISVDRNFPVNTCPRTRPNDIIAWWRKQQPRKRTNEVEATAETLKAQSGEWPNSKTLSRTAGVSSRAADNALRVKKAVEEAVAQTRAENALVTSVKFTKAQDQHVQAKIKMLSRQLEVDFNERVRLAMLQHNEGYRAGLEQLQKEAANKLELAEAMLNNYKPIFTVEEYKILLMIAHPDSKPSQTTLNTAFLALKAKELQLIGRKL